MIFMPSLVEIGPVILEKTMKMWKVYAKFEVNDNDNNDDNDDKGQNSLEPSAQVS